jgi:hypothetical protein
LNLSDTPLAQLKEQDLRPDASALDKIMNGFA